MAYDHGIPRHLSGTEMSIDEIAHELGIKPNTVRMHFQHGMAKLRNRRESPRFRAMRDLADDMARLR
jgi:DNA-directed RNA polymerase specialized sigma24 family protein